MDLEVGRKPGYSYTGRDEPGKNRTIYVSDPSWIVVTEPLMEKYQNNGCGIWDERLTLHRLNWIRRNKTGNTRHCSPKPY